MRKNHQIGNGRRRHVFRNFCLLFFLLGAFVWLELYSRIPDHLITTADRALEKQLSGQLPDWVEEKIEETVQADAGQTSGIPRENLNLTANTGDNENALSQTDPENFSAQTDTDISSEADDLTLAENETDGGTTISRADANVSSETDSLSRARDETVDGTTEFQAEAPESYTIQCSAFGIIPIKEVQVEVSERQKVTACGVPVGIYIKTQGVLIVGTGEVVDIAGEARNLDGDLVRSGDYILAVNEVPVTEKEEVVEQISQAVNGQVKLSVLRGGEILDLTVPVVQTGESEYKAGIWIRDDTQGIGTLTYVTEDGSFGALGHGISDIDTSTLLTLEGGNLYQASISSIIRGVDGVPGEVQGIIDYQKSAQLGEITENTELGIFGTLNEKTLSSLTGTELETAYRQEVQSGEAQILSAVSGTVKTYDIEIEKVNLNSGDANKGMVIRITDPKLLELTGGIIQGMSGSPIMQNGRLVGAVTHVFVKDPTKGYGIFIENMLDRETV